MACFGFLDWKEVEVEIETKLCQLLEKVPHHAPAYATLTFLLCKLGDLWYRYLLLSLSLSLSSYLLSSFLQYNFLVLYTA